MSDGPLLSHIAHRVSRISPSPPAHDADVVIREDAVALDDPARHVAADAISARLDRTGVSRGRLSRAHDRRRTWRVAADAELVVGCRIVSCVAMWVVAAHAREAPVALPETAAAPEADGGESDDHRVIRRQALRRRAAVAGGAESHESIRRLAARHGDRPQRMSGASGGHVRCAGSVAALTADTLARALEYRA